MIRAHFYGTRPGHVDRDGIRSGQRLDKLRIVCVRGGISEADGAGCYPVCADRILTGFCRGGFRWGRRVVLDRRVYIGDEY